MDRSVLIAGIGNIFHGDDAFGISVIQRLATVDSPSQVRLMDVGIRAIDLGFALLDGYELTILVDATSRGGVPGTLYTIEIEPDDVPDLANQTLLVNSHGLNPVSVLALAKSMGANFKRLLLVGCEPSILDRDDTGHIGLSEAVEAAVNPAVQIIQSLVASFLYPEEVYSHEIV
ncbi:MAG TPA: hydrogenase maturation protease [Bryobacteraceae bacterium]|nr:hydrogenase maturation protease [Bryobacteraceae bacterium]